MPTFLEGDRLPRVRSRGGEAEACLLRQVPYVGAGLRRRASAIRS